MNSDLAKAIQLRKENRAEEALQILQILLKTHPDDPDINYQAAWTCDSLGRESEAAPYYEAALANGLVHDKLGAMLGLGSTYRCLGEYQKGLDVLNRAVSEFPQERSLKVFRALCLYNLGESREAVSELLIQLIQTTNDTSIQKYQGALNFYSDKLDETWS